MVSHGSEERRVHVFYPVELGLGFVRKLDCREEALCSGRASLMRGVIYGWLTMSQLLRVHSQRCR